VTEVALSLGSRREEFDVPHEVAYFNTANLSPVTHRVRDAAAGALARRAQPWTIGAEDWFTDVERLRGLFAQIVGGDVDGVALVPATSYGFAVATRNIALDNGDRIVVLAEEYPSGIYSWRELAARSEAEIVTVARRGDQSWTEAVLAELEEPAAVVSVPNVHWTDGALIELGPVAERAHELGARLVIDASQSAGVMELDVAALRPDFLVSVGYKWLLGPFALGYLWVAPEHRDGAPIEQNWILRENARDFARLVDYRDAYEPGARRFDMGQRTSFQLVPMAVAALEQLLEWEIARVAATLAETTGALAAGAAELGLEPAPADRRGPHLLGIQLPDDLRIRVLPALEEAGCYAALRGDALRLSPHLHNTPAEVERLLGALAQAVRR
jgi:selenocysteine lyase/cysteine desulfurase